METKKVEPKPCKCDLKDMVSVENNWQESDRTNAERLSYMLRHHILSDVHFVVGEVKKCFSAHRLILSMRSPVFYAMFNGSLALADDEEVIVPDIEPESFYTVLKYIYNEDVKLDAATVFLTLYAAKKYELPGLERKCEGFLGWEVTSEDVFLLLSHAKFFQQRGFMISCLRVIDNDALRSFQGEGFTDIDKDLLCSILSRDSLAIEEIDLFDAVERWACAECRRRDLDQTAFNKRRVLGNALFMIRFPLMTAEEFSGRPVQSGLLTDAECLDVLLYLTAGKRPETVFPTQPRVLTRLSVKFIIGRFAWRKRKNLCFDELRFSTDQAATIQSIAFNGTTSPAKFTATVVIKPSLPNAEPIAKGVFSYTLADSFLLSPSLFHATFPKRIKIDPGKEYIISTCVISNLDAVDCFVGPTASMIVAFAHINASLRFRFHKDYDGFIAKITFLLE